MANQATQLLTPVGRLVQGSPFHGQDKDAEGRPLVIKTGPNAGQPRLDYFFALAVSKTDPGVNALIETITGVARQEFPSLFDASGNCVNPKFAFKITDGDSQVPNSSGIKPCDREGFPGHWIFKFSGGYPPRCYKKEQGALVQTQDENELKTGYYVRVAGSVTGNGSQQQPGVFLNHSMIELVGYGEVIVTGPNPNDVFGDAPALPPGASATPPAPTTPAPAAAPAPQPAAPVAPQPAAGVQPAHDFTNPAPAPQPAAAPAPEPTYSVNGVSYSAEQLRASGWPDERINALPRA